MVFRYSIVTTALVMTAALLAPARPVLAQLCFERKLVDTIANPGYSASGDIDGDGDVDVLVISHETNTLVCFENTGGSPPSFITRALADVPPWIPFPTLIELADVDRDGDLDVLTAGGEAPYTIELHENNGAPSPTFTHRVIATTDYGPSHMRSGDLDADGDTDIIFCPLVWVGNPQWLENNGASPPEFTHRTIQSPNSLSFSGFECADIDGDSRLDIVGSSRIAQGEYAIWWIQNQGGTPPQFVERMIGDSETAPVMVADVDDDSDLDVVTGNGYLANDGAAAPAFAQQLFGPNVLDSTLREVADLDADGDLDVLVTLYDNSILAWLESDGATPPVFLKRSIDTGRFYTPPIVDDLDGDSDLDVAHVFDYPVSSLVWYESVEVFNPDQGRVYSLLHSAIEDAISGDTLVAFPGHFGLDAAPSLDLLGKAVDVQSRGPLVRPGATETILAGGSALRASEGEDIVFEGSLSVPPDAVAEVRGQAVTISGGLLMGARSGLVIGLHVVLKALGFEQRTISSADTPWLAGIRAADTDGDGDLDVIAAASSKILLFENDGGDPPQFAPRTLGTVPLDPVFGMGYTNPYLDHGQGAFTIQAADFDGDGDVDVVSYQQSDKVLFWENDGQFPAHFASVPLSSAGSYVGNAEHADLDGDSDIDLLWRSGPVIGWSENNGGTPPTFTSRSVGGPVWAFELSAADVDGDGDLDVLAGEYRYKRFVWLENDGASPPSFIRHDVPAASFTNSVVASDLDRDGDADLLVQFNQGGRAWYENDGAQPPVFTEHIISTQARGTWSPRVADFDADGDMDLVASPGAVGTIAWHENDGASPPAFIERELMPDATGVTAVELADFDGDGMLDVLSASSATDTMEWNANRLHSKTLLTHGAQIACEADVSVVNRAVDIQAPSRFSAGAAMTLDTTTTLRGNGLVSATVLHSAGLIAPDAGKVLTIVGDYRQFIDADANSSTPGSLLVGFDDSGVLGTLAVTGEAALAGVLRATAAPAFAPPIGRSFPMLTAKSLAPGSRFDTALFPNVGSDRFLSVVYEPEPTRTPGHHPRDLDLPDSDPLPDGITSDPRVGAAVAVVVNSLTGDVTLEPHPGADPGTSGVPKGATLGDIDLDGDPDLLIALPDALNPTTAPGSVVILYNADDGNPGNGWEGFGDTLQVTTGVGVNPSSVAVGRIDADSQPDIVVSNRGTPGANGDDTVSVLLVSNPAPLTFALSATPSLTVGDEPADVIIADMDGDDILDIITADAGSSSVSVGWNAGVGTGPAWSPQPPSKIDLPDEDDVPVSVRPGDTNADAFAFLATANSGTNSIGLIQVNPDRSTVVLPNVPAGNAPVELVIADFDLDGEDDIATVNRNSSSITIVLGNTGASPTLVMGSPSDLPIPSTASAPRSIAAGDFDSDASGDIDIAILADGVVKVLRNDLFNNQLAFTPVPDQAAGTAPLLVRSADLNVDGRDDVVTIAESTGLLLRGGERTEDAVNILLAAPEPCAGDVTGDGDTNVSDFNVMASNFGQSVAPNTNGDLNGDGLVNVSDFNIVAGNFGCQSQ